MTASSTFLVVPSSPGWRFTWYVALATLMLGFAAIPIVIGGESRTLECRRDTNRCAITDWKWGIVRKSVTFPATAIVEVSVMKSFSRRPSRGIRHYIYYWTVSARPAFYYASDTEYAFPSDPKLVEQFQSAVEFADNLGLQIYDGRRFATSDFWMLVFSYQLLFSAAFVVFYSVREFSHAGRK